ncbi:MAG: type II secretion system F family protein [Syntrophomonadaceae bacterium]|nr:type II secretion system F family protein [Syntrophomonadaceae bacterium]
MRFRYQVRDTAGTARGGVLEADHKEAMIAGLLQQGYAIIALKEMAVDQSGRALHRPIRVESRELASFTGQLAVMLTAGLPLLNSLHILLQQTRGRDLQRIVERVTSDVRSGSGLGDALGQHPQVFPPIYVNTIRAGEASGTLDTVVLQLSSHLGKFETFNRKLKSASAYPIFTALLAVAIMVMMMTFVIPRFAGVFEASGAQLPWLTRVLLNAAGSGLEQMMLVFLGMAGLMLLLVKYSFRIEGGRRWMDSLKLKMPVIGDLEKKRIMVALTSTLGMLLQAGVPLLKALQVAAGTITNYQGREVLQNVIRSISAGESLAVPLRQSGLFPPMLTDMIAVGEATGSLDTVLGQLAEYCERELTDRLENLARMIEPLLILLVAVMVGGIVIALLLPMMNMVSLVGM